MRTFRDPRLARLFVLVAVPISLPLLSWSLTACSTNKTVGARFVAEKATTPEDAINRFVVALAEGDGEKVLRSFAIQSYADGYRFEANADRTQALNPARDMRPSNSPMFRSFNEVARASESADQVTVLVYSMISSMAKDPERLTSTQSLEGAGGLAKDFVASLDLTKLKPLTVKKIAQVAAPGTVQADRIKSIWASRSKIAGADETREYLVLYELGSQTFTGGVTALRYGKAWSIYSLNSALGGTSGDGLTVASSSAEFDAAVADVNEKP